MSPKQPLAPAKAGECKNRPGGALAPTSAKASGAKASDSMTEIKQLLQAQMEKQAEMLAQAQQSKGRKGASKASAKAPKDDLSSSFCGRQRKGDKIVAAKFGKMAVGSLLQHDLCAWHLAAGLHGCLMCLPRTTCCVACWPFPVSLDCVGSGAGLVDLLGAHTHQFKSCAKGTHFSLTYLNKQPNEALWALTKIFWDKDCDSDVDLPPGCVRIL